MDVAHRMVDIGDVRLHCAEMGQGPLVLLLHGFPECWVSWRNQMPALAAAGFRAVAPDLRGYGKSDKPRDLDAYRSALGEILPEISWYEASGDCYEEQQNR